MSGPTPIGGTEPAAAGELAAAADETVGEPGPADEAWPTPDVRRELFINSIGGWRGVLDSALPVVVFIVANTLGGLTVAVWTAIGVGVALVVLRLALRQSVQQAFSGFFGLAIAALIARQTGEARGFFLVGIWGSLIYACLFALSAVIRRPVVGLVWEWLSPSPQPWRKTPALMRVYTATTLIWASVSLARFLVQDSLYDAEETGWLAAARLIMGYPLTLAALGITLFWVRRVRHRVEERAAA